jgi:hypothetical protein
MKKKCSKCGSPPVDESSQYCNKCGSLLSPEKSCLHCGKIFLDDESLFCDRCGSPLSQTTSPALPGTGGRICQACGFQNDEETYFHCKNCGAPLRRRIFGGKSERALSSGKPIHLISERPDIRHQKTLPEPEFEFVVPEPISREIQPEKRIVLSRRSAMIGAAIILVLVIVALFAFAALDPKNAGWGNAGTAFLDNLTKPVAAATANLSPVNAPNLPTTRNPNLVAGEKPAPPIVLVPAAPVTPTLSSFSPLRPDLPVSNIASPVTADQDIAIDDLPVSNIASPAISDPALVI